MQLCGQDAQAQHVQPGVAQTQPHQATAANTNKQRLAKPMKRGHFYVKHILSHVPDNDCLQAWRKKFVGKWEDYNETTQEPFESLNEDVSRMLKAYCKKASLQMPQCKKRIAQQTKGSYKRSCK